MKVVNLIGGDRRSPEEGESYVSKGSVLCGAPSPILALHDAIVRRRTTKRDSIALVIGAHAGEGTAPGNASFEVVNMRGLQVCAGRLIMAAVLIQPGDGERLGAPVFRRWPPLRLLSGSAPVLRRSPFQPTRSPSRYFSDYKLDRGCGVGSYSRLRLSYA